MPYRRVTDGLARCADKVRQRDRLAARIARLQAELVGQRRARAEAEAASQAEQRDVDRLLRRSVTRFMARLSAEGLQTRLQREQIEADVAALRLAGLSEIVELAERELAQAQAMVADLGDVDAQYHRALDEKSRLVASVDDERGRAIAAMIEQQVAGRHWQRELHEAMQAGAGTLTALRGAARHLRSALEADRAYNRGAGLLARESREMSLREWVLALAVATSWLSRFHAELHDLHQRLPEGVSLRPFDRRPADFIEQVFGDPHLREKMDAALDNLHEVAQQVAPLVAMLEQRLAEQDAALRGLREAFRTAVEQA